MNSKNITEAVVQSLRNAIEIQKYLDLHTSDPLPTLNK